MKFFLATRLFATVKIFGCQNGVKGRVKKNQGLLQIAKVPKILLNSLKNYCNFAIFRQNYFVIAS